MAKPVYMTRPKMRMAAGARACTSDLDREAMERKNMDITMVRVKEIRTKKKKGPGSRLRLVMK